MELIYFWVTLITNINIRDSNSSELPQDFEHVEQEYLNEVEAESYDQVSRIPDDDWDVDLSIWFTS